MTGRAVAGLLVASCAFVVPAAPTDAPVPTSTTAAASLPPGDIGFGRFANVRDFSVSFAAFSRDGEIKVARLAEVLPMAWENATGGRSKVRIVTGEADIRVVVLTAEGPSSGGGQLITLRFPRPGLTTGEVAVLMHEMGHALGCCFGEGASGDGHWSECDRGAELMCHGGPGLAMRFSERELRALRLR